MKPFFSGRTNAVLGLILTSLFWATNIIVSKWAVDMMPPFSLNFWRWFTAGVILIPWTYLDLIRYWPEIKRNWLQLVLFGMLGVSAYNSLLYNAAHSTSSMNIAVIGTMTPVIAFLFSWLLFRVAPTRYQGLGIVLGLSGVLLIIVEGQWSRLLQLQVQAGDLWMMSAITAWALYTVLLRKKKAVLPSRVFLQITIIFGVMVTLPIMLWETSQTPAFDLNWKLFAMIAYIGVFPSLLAYSLWNHGVVMLGANTAVLFMYTLPVFAAILSVFVLGESIHWFHIAGQLLVFSGFYAAVLLPKK